MEINIIQFHFIDKINVYTNEVIQFTGYIKFLYPLENQRRTTISQATHFIRQAINGANKAPVHEFTGLNTSKDDSARIRRAGAVRTHRQATRQVAAAHNRVGTF